MTSCIVSALRCIEVVEMLPLAKSLAHTTCGVMMPRCWSLRTYNESSGTQRDRAGRLMYPFMPHAPKKKTVL